jgi:solute carrier family 25 phosphate transporter 23/24/25/41
VGQDQGGELTVPQRLACGASAGMTATTLTHPLDVIRVRLATDPKLTGFFDAIRQVSKQRAWFRGWSASVVSLGPFIGINFATFDTLKTWQYPDHRVVKPPVSGTLLLGATAGIIASSICFPLDTIRRRMQVSSGSGAGPKCV